MDESYKSWPENWRELNSKCPSCDRCGTIFSDRLFHLNENPKHVDILVCRSCSDDYHKYIQEFVDEIRTKNDGGEG